MPQTISQEHWICFFLVQENGLLSSAPHEHVKFDFQYEPSMINHDYVVNVPPREWELACLNKTGHKSTLKQSTALNSLVAFPYKQWCLNHSPYPIIDSCFSMTVILVQWIIFFGEANTVVGRQMRKPEERNSTQRRKAAQRGIRKVIFWKFTVYMWRDRVLTSQLFD